MIAIDVDVASGERAYHIAYEDTAGAKSGTWGALHVSGGRIRGSVINMGMIRYDTLVDWEHSPSWICSQHFAEVTTSTRVFWWQDGDEEHLSGSEVRNFVVWVLSERSLEPLRFCADEPCPSSLHFVVILFFRRSLFPINIYFFLSSQQQRF